MKPQVILSLLARKSLTTTAGFVLGAWTCLQFPDEFRAAFESSVAGLIAAMVMLVVSGKWSWANQRKCKPEAKP